MANFNLNDYETVQQRISRFYAKHHTGRIITELMSPISDIKVVVFKASLYLKNDQVSTGWAYEVAGQGFVNKTSHLENCETSAIGRALANFDLHGDKRVSREEMEKVQRMESDLKKELDKQRNVIRAEVKKNPDFMGYLIGEGLDPKVDDNIPEIHKQLSSLKKKFLASEGQ